MLKRVGKFLHNRDERVRVAGWKKRHWRRYSKAQAILHTEQAKWYAEAAEDPMLDEEEHNKRLAMAIMHSHVAQAFKGNK